jgi:hypothetical protein
MLITGSTYRSIASQNILSYSINGNIDSTTGISSFGLSGDNGSLNLFTFRTGKIYDVNNRHVWSYNPSESFAISGNINTGDHHYYINDNLICLSTPKPDHYYKYFYANSQNSVMDLDINVIGNNYPNYSISFPFTYTIGDNITGYISNNSDNSNFSFQFFTGQTVGQPYYSLFNLDNNFVSGTQSGEFILNYTSTLDPNSPSSGAGELEPLLGNLSFNTNFGNVVYNLNIPINKRPYYFADFIEIFTGIIQQDSFFNYNYVYELRTKSPTDQDVFISLSNKAGHLKELYSGAFSATGTISNTLSGFIYGDDYITGILTGNVVSNFPNYYGNLITGFATGFESVQQYATGLINYYYNVPVPGGSALGTAPPGTVIEATGYIDNLTGTTFIYNSRPITGAKTGFLSGYWYDYLQTGTGIITVTESPTIYFTGISNIDNINFNWNSIPYIGFDIENYNSNYNYKIYGITGSGNYTFISSDSGVRTTGITTQQNTGELINYIFRLDYNDISTISGEVFGSENTSFVKYVFGENSPLKWGTGPNISTGFLGFQFKNFSPNDSGIVRHYELSLDRDFDNYKFTPSVFKLQGSNNNISWNDMDTRSGINFYRSQTNIFPVTGTGLYNYVRLLITSGQLLQHVNQDDLEARAFGLSVNKIYFYEKTVSGNVTGLYKNFIDNNVTGNYFYSSFNTGAEPDYLFSNTTSNLFFASNLNKEQYPYAQIFDGFIGYKTAYVYTGIKITGFYIDFEPDYYRPDILTIEASNNTGNGYNVFYKKSINNNTESGLLSTGIIISGITGYQYFKFNFIGDYGLESSFPFSCATGWKIATSPSASELYSWNDITLSNNANKSLIVSNYYTGSGPYTGYVFQNTNGYDSNFSPIIFTGSLYEEVQLKSVAFDKNSGQYILVSRDGNILYTGNIPNAQNYKVYLNNSSGVQLYNLVDNFVFTNFITSGGNSIASNLSGNVIMIGNTINPIVTNNSSGSIIIYTGNSISGLQFRQQITGGSGLSIGNNVTSNSDASVIIAGSPNSANLTGVAVIFTGNSNAGWNFRQTITGNGILRGSGLRYGSSIAIDSGSNIIVMGGPFDNLGTGAAMIFTGNSNAGWIFRQKISGQAPLRSGNFGSSVAINSGNIIFVGAPITNLGSGTVSIFTGNNRNTWIIRQTLSGSSRSLFGSSLADNNDGSILVVGAPTGYNNTGSAYVYTGSITSNWRLKQEITGDSIGQFGSSVAINPSGNIIIIGGYTNNIDSGSALIYSGDATNGWQFVQKIQNTGTGLFATNVAINSGNILAVTAPSNNLSGTFLYNFEKVSVPDPIFKPVGLDGAWVDVAMSQDNKIMAAVGPYDIDLNRSAQISTNSGITWTEINDLNSFNLTSITMSSGGDIMYSTQRSSPDDYVWRSIDFGSNWNIMYTLSNYFIKDIATDNLGDYVVFASDFGIYNSSDNGFTWTRSVLPGDNNWIKVAMSNNGQFQLAIEDNGNQIARSSDYGVNWSFITGLDGLDLTSISISNDGKFQYAIGNGTRLYNNCTYSYDLPPFPEVRVKKLNLYTSQEKDFFDLNPLTITGFGNMNFSVGVSGTGLLTNPTGEIFFPAVSYETGLLNGLITDGGSYTWNDIFISSTGRPNNVFVDRVTGFRNASGIIRFKMDLIRDFDYITINDITFNYSNQISDSNYNFHSLAKLINVLNAGAIGAIDDFTLSDVVGVTGSLNIDSFKTGLLTGLTNSYGESVDISNNNIIVVGGPNDGSNGSARIYSKNTNNNNWDFYQTITGNFSNGRYGTSLSINNDGTKILIGGPNSTSALGSFDIYSGNITNGWSLQQSIGGYFFAPVGVGGYARWGDINSVAINSGNRLLVGGYAGMNETGMAILYTGINNFSIANVINAPTAVTSSVSKARFGSSVAINTNGNILVIGAPHTSLVGGYGSVCIYNASIPNSVSNVQILNRPSTDVGSVSSFGKSVAINDNGNIIVVGTPAFTTGASLLVGGYRLGLVSIYTGNLESTWTLKQQITGFSNNMFFGTDVDINSEGNVIGVGGYNNFRAYYTGNSINGWGASNVFTGLSINTAIAVNDNVVVGGYSSLNLANVSEINDANIRLFSHNPSGENGNNTKLTRYASDLNAIQIPNRYLLGGQTFRPLSNTWEGNFEETFNFTVENSGIYTIQPQENISIDISGVAYENNFYPNWSGDVTLISEGTVLNTGLTINLLPDIYWRSSQVFTGTNASNANLGTKIFIENNIILASQPNGSFAGGSSPGPVIFYTGNNNRWTLGPNLTGNFGINSAQFGTSLATWDGSPIVFGGPLDNNGTGSALIYTRNTPTSWILRTKLTGIIDKSPQRPFGSETSKYGTNVAVSSGNDIILMSSPWNNTGFGSTLIYTGNSSVGWQFRQELYGQKQGFYGQGLAIDNNADVIILGGFWGGTNSPFPTDGGINIFTGNKINGWTFAKDISGENGGNYGESVAVNKDGSTIVIGGRFDGSGAVLIYTGNKINSSWTFSQKISGDFSQFGKNISISDNDIIVVSSDQSNKTSIFTKNLNTNKWQPRPKFIFNSDNIGSTYISNSGTIVVGLPNLDSAIYTNPGGLTILNSGLDILTGMYRIPSGLSYLGYSGLNIEFNKYIYNNSKTGIDFAEYSVTSDNFTFTGIIRG